MDNLIDLEGISFSIDATHTAKDIEVNVNTKQGGSWVVIEELHAQFIYGGNHD